MDSDSPLMFINGEIRARLEISALWLVRLDMIILSHRLDTTSGLP